MVKIVNFLSVGCPLGAQSHSYGSRRAESLVVDDLGERLPGLRWVGASAFGTDVLVAEGESRPHQPLARDAQDVLGRLPALAVEPADRGPEPVRLGDQLEPL